MDPQPIQLANWILHILLLASYWIHVRSLRYVVDPTRRSNRSIRIIRTHRRIEYLLEDDVNWWRGTVITCALVIK